MRIGFFWGILSGSVTVAALAWIAIALTEARDGPEPPAHAVASGGAPGRSDAGQTEAGAPASDQAPAAAPQGESSQDAAKDVLPADGRESISGAGSAKSTVQNGAAGAETLGADGEPAEADTERSAGAGAGAVAGAQDSGADDPADFAGPARADAEPRTEPSDEPGRLAAIPQPAPAAPELAAPPGGDAARSAAATPDLPSDPLAARFDIVRVDAGGQAVIAGMARPGQLVEILLDGDVVESVEADPSGNFVAVISAELGSEARQLQLRVSVPEADLAAAGDPHAAGTPPAAEAGQDARITGTEAPTGETAETATGLASRPEIAAPPALPGFAAAPEHDTPAAAAPDAALEAGGASPVPSLPARQVPEQIDTETPSVEGLRSPETAEAQGSSPDGEQSPAAAPERAGDGLDAAARREIATAGQPDEASALAGPPTVSDRSETPRAGEAGSTDEPGEQPAPIPDAAIDASDPGRSGPVVGTATESRPPAATSARDGAAIVESEADRVTSSAAEPSAIARPEPAGGTGAAPVPTDPPEPGMRYALSAPVLILPSQQVDGAPTLVQPGADRLALLQPGGETGGPADGVVLDQITYDTTGDVLMRGRATDGHAVRVYGDGRLLETVPVREGLWQLSLPRDRVEQLSLLRFDEIEPAGRVTSRIEAPFRYTGDRPQVVRDREVVIQRGDNLWRIAEQYYGEGLRYSVIYGANSELIRDPDLIYPDQVFTIPELVEAD